MPDERRYLQTKFKKKTCNPVFDETYIFQVDSAETQACTTTATSPKEQGITLMILKVALPDLTAVLGIVPAQIPARHMDERTLKLTVVDNERGKHHNIIGHAIFPLSQLDWACGENTLVTWKDLDKQDAQKVGHSKVPLC